MENEENIVESRLENIQRFESLLGEMVDLRSKIGSLYCKNTGDKSHQFGYVVYGDDQDDNYQLDDLIGLWKEKYSFLEKAFDVIRFALVEMRAVINNYHKPIELISSNCYSVTQRLVSELRIPRINEVKFIEIRESDLKLNLQVKTPAGELDVPICHEKRLKKFKRMVEIHKWEMESLRYFYKQGLDLNSYKDNENLLS